MSSEFQFDNRQSQGGFFHRVILAGGFAGSLLAVTSLGQELPLVRDLEVQPLAAQVRRVNEALDYLGSPLPSWSRRVGGSFSSRSKIRRE